MPSNDPFDRPAGEIPEPNSFPPAEAPTAGTPFAPAGPAPTDRVAAEPAAARPPRPGFWAALLWCLVFLLLVNGTVLAVAGAAFVVRSARGFRLPADAAQLPLAELLERPGVADALSDALAPALLIAEVLSVGFALGVIRLVVGREWPRLLALRRPGLHHVVLVLLALPAVLILPSGVAELAQRVLPSAGNMEALKDLFRHWSWWFGVLVIGLAPGVGEELWTRGFLGRGLVGRYGWVAGVLLTSALFGLMHVDPPHAVATAVMGVWLHFVYVTGRSLWLPILLHFVNNALGVLVVLPAGPVVPGFQALERAAEQSPVLVYATASLLVAGVAWALYQSRARLVSVVPEGGVAWRPPFAGVEYPPAGSGTVVVRPWPDRRAAGLVAAAVVLFGLSVYLAPILTPG
jgi:membrane protease YdiL (CAAX protease family)